jgi:hypothetical protein
VRAGGRKRGGGVERWFDGDGDRVVIWGQYPEPASRARARDELMSKFASRESMMSVERYLDIADPWLVSA